MTLPWIRKRGKQFLAWFERASDPLAGLERPKGRVSDTPERCGGSGRIFHLRDDPRGPEFNSAPDSTAAGDVRPCPGCPDCQPATPDTPQERGAPWTIHRCRRCGIHSLRPPRPGDDGWPANPACPDKKHDIESTPVVPASTLAHVEREAEQLREARDELLAGDAWPDYLARKAEAAERERDEADAFGQRERELRRAELRRANRLDGALQAAEARAERLERERDRLALRLAEARDSMGHAEVGRKHLLRSGAAERKRVERLEEILRKALDWSEGRTDEHWEPEARAALDASEGGE